MTVTSDQATAMASLSRAAYDYSYNIPEPLNQVLHAPVAAPQNLTGSGWTALTWADLNPLVVNDPLPAGSFDNDGFYVNGPAAALVSPKNGVRAVAVRGSDGSIDPMSENPLSTDFDAATLHGQDEYFQLLVPLFDKISAYISACAILQLNTSG